MEEINDEFLQSINNESVEEDLSIGGMLESSDKESILLGLTLGEFKDRWYKIYNDFIETMNQDSTQTIQEAIRNAFPRIPTPHTPGKNLEEVDWKLAKKIKRTVCAKKL